MLIANALDFIAACCSQIRNDTVQAWVWGEDDETFGKSVSWPIGADNVEAIASVDLQSTQLTLSISERDISGQSDGGTTEDAEVTFVALVQFEDQTVTLNGDTLPYTRQAIQDVIMQFNACV